MSGSHSHGGAKESAAIASVLASAFLVAIKLVAAWLTGSLGILSEVIHSLLDFGATLITWYAVRVADRPADDKHHYGHAKVESLGALAETGLLFGASAWILWEAGSRLITGHVEVEAHPVAIAIVIGSIAVDYFRARALNRVAIETKSQALEADALHFTSDMWSSIVVLGGLGLVALGFPMGDPIAASVVAILVVIAGWRLGRRTLDTLLDAAPEGAGARIRDIVERVSGVVALERLRVRPAGSVLFVDMDLAVARTRSITDIAAMKAEIAAGVQAEMPEAQVSIVTHPRALDDETVHDRIMVIARNRGLAVHHLTVQSIAGPGAEPRLAVSLDLEVPGRMTLEDAHLIATGLEDAIATELGAGVEVETHIEPMIEHGIDGVEVDPAEAANILVLLEHAAAAAAGDVHEIHNVRARRTADGTIVNFHCRLDPAMSVDDMHAAIDEVERIVRSERPDIRRAIGHAEPRGVPHPARDRG